MKRPWSILMQSSGREMSGGFVLILNTLTIKCGAEGWYFYAVLLEVVMNVLRIAMVPNGFSSISYCSIWHFLGLYFTEKSIPKGHCLDSRTLCMTEIFGVTNYKWQCCNKT
jgi:hypothetical protein